MLITPLMMVNSIFSHAASRFLKRQAIPLKDLLFWWLVMEILMLNITRENLKLIKEHMC